MSLPERPLFNSIQEQDDHRYKVVLHHFFWLYENLSNAYMFVCCCYK